MNNQNIANNLRQLFLQRANEQGYLNRDELRRLCSSLKISDNQVNLIVGQLDRNGNGRVGIDDFVRGFCRVIDGDNLAEHQMKTVGWASAANGQWSAPNDSTKQFATRPIGTGTSETTHDNSISADLLIPKHNSTIMNPHENWWDAARTIAKSPLNTEPSEARCCLEQSKTQVNADRSLETSKCHCENNERNQIGENIEATNKQLSIDSEGCLKKQDTCHVAFEDKETLSALDKPKCSDKSCRGHHTFNETNDESTSEQCLQTSYTTEGEWSDDHANRKPLNKLIKCLLVNTIKLTEENRKLLANCIRFQDCNVNTNSSSRSSNESSEPKSDVKFKRLDQQASDLVSYMQALLLIQEKIELMAITNDEAVKGLQDKVDQSRNESTALMEMLCQLHHSVHQVTNSQQAIHQHEARHNELKRELLQAFADQRAAFKEPLEEEDEEEEKDKKEITFLKEANRLEQKWLEMEKRTASRRVEWLPGRQARHRFRREHSFTWDYRAAGNRLNQFACCNYPTLRILKNKNLQEEINGSNSDARAKNKIRHHRYFSVDNTWCSITHLNRQSSLLPDASPYWPANCYQTECSGGQSANLNRRHSLDKQMSEWRHPSLPDGVDNRTTFLPNRFLSGHQTQTCKQRTVKSSLNSRNNAHQASFKLIFVGDSTVGKTSFICRASRGAFPTSLSSTIGIDFSCIQIEISGKFYEIQLWDTAGQERYRGITSNYFRRVDGICLMYDASSEKSFLNVRNWINSIQDTIQPPVALMLVGNKVDIRNSRPRRPCISPRQGFEMAAHLGTLCIFMETSCKTGFNVNDAVMRIARRMIHNRQAIQTPHVQSAIQLAIFNKKQDKCCALRSI